MRKEVIQNLIFYQNYLIRNYYLIKKKDETLNIPLINDITDFVIFVALPNNNYFNIVLKTICL